MGILSRFNKSSRTEEHGAFTDQHVVDKNVDEAHVHLLTPRIFAMALIVVGQGPLTSF